MPQQPQKRTLSPPLKAVSFKSSPAKDGVSKQFSSFICPKCQANISFHGRDVNGNLGKFQMHLISHFQGTLLRGIIDNKTARRLGTSLVYLCSLVSNTQFIVTIMCCNDELSWLFNNRFSATRYMKVKKMGITTILRRIWLFSANKIKSSESVRKH